MATSASKSGQDSRHRATAVKNGLMLEEKKKLRSRILDLILEAYDLPSQRISSPTEASSVDIKLFKTSLGLFQPSDFDDLVRERNIDERCGYALCSNPNKKLAPGGAKVWNGKGGREFRLVDRAELERWCSAQCDQRAAFVRAQLSTEPAWLRDSQFEDIKLLDEMPKTGDLADVLQVCHCRLVDVGMLTVVIEPGSRRCHGGRPECEAQGPFD